MKLQQWGTFSVKDHLKSRAFVAEVLLFDRLVIPRPASEREIRAEGQGHLGEDQIERWRAKGWFPERQRELLDVLGEYDLTLELPWGRQAEAHWQSIMEPSPIDPAEGDRSALRQAVDEQVETAKSQAPDAAPYIASGGVLSLYVAGEMHNDLARKFLNRVKTPETEVEPVIAYGSYGEFADDQGVSIAHQSSLATQLAKPYALFGWEFFVPEDSEKSDTRLLQEAAKLASKTEFREARQDFHGWLKQMYAGEVDSQEAREKMSKKLDEYTSMMAHSGLKTVSKYAAKAATVLAPLVGLAHHNAGIEAGVVVGGMALAMEWLLPKTEAPAHLRPAAVLYDAKRHFGRR
jgi:hypothetical protein